MSKVKVGQIWKWNRFEDLVKVVSVQNEMVYYVYLNRGLGKCDWNIKSFEKNLILVSEKPYTWESRFNIDDKVVVEDEGICTVTSINFDIDGTQYELDGCWFANESELTLYQEPKIKEVTMEELEKKYGCKVKIVEGE
jgi:hypothetical protein